MELRRFLIKLITNKVILKSLIVLLAIAVVSFTVLITLPVYFQTQGLAKAMGSGAGEVTGIAIGSLRGLANAQEAINQGKKEGTSAQDTDVNIAGIKASGNLEVLVVNQDIGNFIRIGDHKEVFDAGYEDPSTEKVVYSILKVTPAQAVFSVNLANADIRTVGNNYKILLDDPTVNITKFSDESIVLAEFKKFNLSFDAAAIADQAITNSEIKTTEEAKKALLEDEELMRRAKESAKTQVTLIAEAICGKDRVRVDFK